MKSDIDTMADILPKANAAGMRLVLGDDYGAIFFPHGAYAEELAYYVEEIGIPPLDVIRWATKHGAELMGRGHELGTVAPASSPICWWSTATPSPTSPSSRTGHDLLAIMKDGRMVKDDLAGLAAG